MKTVSQAERIDLLLTLATAFGRKFADTAGGLNAEQFVTAGISAFPDEDRNAVIARLEMLDGLDPDQREKWHLARLERVRRRGRSDRFDENINPSQIVEVLGREPRAVQDLILRNLPSDLSRRITLYLDLKFVPDAPAEPSRVDPAVVALVRRAFLRNFVTLEDLYEPDELDRFSVDELEDFIRHLGLREIAIACRGIGSKETLAAFLNRFDEEDAREIALYLTELDKIRPFWVAQADILVRKSWSADLPPARVVKKVGNKLLASVFANRDESKAAYAAQKVSIREVKNWNRLVRVGRKVYQNADAEERPRLDKRRRIVERLASKFLQTGRL